mgnify:CR=1 FL=1|tara:strand:+ start:623 stop:1648 length:1026 start_codon:yes stop_codon:yes gene_type:complete
MKIELQHGDENQNYSSRLEVGDYAPFFVIENGERVLDLQVKACRYNLLVFVAHEREELIEEAATLEFPYSTYIIADAPTAISHPDHFFDAQVFRLFAEPNSAITASLCDKNLKICFTARGDTWQELLDSLPQESELPISSAPPPVLLVPDVISDSLAQRLIAFLDEREEDAFKNTGDYKSRSHIHPNKELERELDDKLSKSLLPEIEKVFYSQISHRETYKVCCYDAKENGSFGKHRDTIDPHLHRRYALTLALNDDFEGGGICFPEYTEELLQIPKGWAVVFPGSLFHRVNAIGVGRRYVLVSFFFTEAEAKLKEGSERYRFQVQRDLRGVHINKLTPNY